LSNPKKHHFISQFQLEYFQDPIIGKVWEYDVVRNSLTPKRTEEIAAENYLYSVRDKDTGKKDHSIEKGLAQLEELFAKVVQKMHQLDFDLSNEERSLLALHVSLQLQRTPQNRDRTKNMVAKLTKWQMSWSIGRDHHFEDTLREAAKKHPELANITKEQADDLRRTFLEQDYDLEVPNEYHLYFMLQNGQEIASHIHDISWVFLVASKQTQFLISDDPFVMYYPRTEETPFWIGPGIKIKGTQITLPLTNRVCLYMQPGPQVTLSQHINKKQVGLINRRTARHSRRFVYSASDRLVQSIAERTKLAERGERKPLV
jgi:hypothetical protein